MKPNMPAATLVRLFRSFSDARIEVWIDGGWGVDALLGEQTRPHGDLDIVVQQNDLARLVEFLRSRGYDDVERDDTRWWNFVLGDHDGHEVDIHVINFDGEGNGIYGPAENGEAYPTYAFTGSGKVNDQVVACMSATYQLVKHREYKTTANDLHDMSRLRDRFDVDT